MLSTFILVGLLLSPTKGYNVTFESVTSLDKYGGNTPGHVFDGLLTTKYHSGHTDDPKWLQLELSSPVIVESVFILNDNR